MPSTLADTLIQESANVFSIHRHFSPQGLFTRLFTLLALVCLAACNGGGSSGSPAVAPSGITLQAIDSGVIVTWNQDPTLDYWIFSAAAPSITTTNYIQFPDARVQKSVVSPLIISGLTNGTTYSLVMNSTKSGSPAGPASSSFSFVPKIAGVTWTAKTPFATANITSGTAGTAANLVTVGSGGAIYTTTDRTTWTPRTSTTTNDLKGVAFSAATSSFVAVGANGTIITSSDGVTWTARTSGVSSRLNAVAYAITFFVAVGDGGVILTSTDGVTWTQQTSGTTNNLYGVSVANGILVAVGANGTVRSSPDAGTWTAYTVPTTADLYSVAYGFSNYIVVGNAGTILSSADLTTWTLQNPVSQPLYSIAISTQAVVVGAGGTILYGLPTTSWSVAASGTSSNLNNVTLFSGYTALGNAGANTYSQ